jgi:transcription elongation factor GreB
LSKAFAGEVDGDEERVIEPPQLPPGTPNYITPAGARRLAQEREQLIAEKATLKGDDFEGKNRLQRLERRLRFLTPRVETFKVIDPLQQTGDQVLFGATVTVVDGQNHEAVWRIVGLDEVDLDKGAISWMSPLAVALLQKKAGDVVSFQSQRLTVRRIQYTA